jgi:site-specific DNA-methyltransferase (adenine-specific)
MEIIYKKLNEIKPYEKNPRKIGENAVNAVANSIREFGFKNPIIIDENNYIVAGHTRYQAAKKLKLNEVPCILADGLTDEQIRAFRLADNKTNEFSKWDEFLLLDELQSIDSIDMRQFGIEAILNEDESGEDSKSIKDVRDTIRDGSEIDTENFSDESFDYECPNCGFKFNLNKGE